MWQGDAGMTDIGDVTLPSTHGTALEEEDTGENGFCYREIPKEKGNRFASLTAEQTAA